MDRQSLASKMPKNRNTTYLIKTLALFSLFSMATCQVLLESFGEFPAFLIAHDLRKVDLYIYIGGLTLVTLAAASLPCLFSWVLSKKISDVIYWAFFYVLGFLLILVKINSLNTPVNVWVLGIVTASAAYGFLVLARRHTGALKFLSLLSLMHIVFIINFIYFSPAGSVFNPVKTSGSSKVNKPEELTPIVIVVFDEMATATLLNKNMEIDEAAFPNFARLADSSTWYRNATTVACSTNLAVSSIVTGRFPNHKVASIVDNHPNNLFTTLDRYYNIRTGRMTHRLQRIRNDESMLDYEAFLMDNLIFLAHVIVPYKLKTILPPIDQTTSHFLTGGKPKKKKANAGERPSLLNLKVFFNALKKHRGSRNYLYFLYQSLPHVPWIRLPDGTIYTKNNYLAGWMNNETWSENRFYVLQGYQRHLLQSAYVDGVLGRIVSAMKENDFFDQALLVVTVDHGVSFHPGESRREVFNMSNISDAISIPLFIKYPNQKEGDVVDKPTSILDIAPTIFDHLGVRPHFQLDGVSLLQDIPERKKAVVYPHNYTNHQPAELPMDLLEKIKEAVDYKLRYFSPGSKYFSPPPPDDAGTPVSDYNIKPSDQYKLTLTSDKNSVFIEGLVAGNFDGRNADVLVFYKDTLYDRIPLIDQKSWYSTKEVFNSRKTKYFSFLNLRNGGVPAESLTYYISHNNTLLEVPVFRL